MTDVLDRADASSTAPTRPHPGGRRLDPRDRLIALGFGAFSFLFCLFSFTKWPTEWDSIQLTLGVDRFDVQEYSPHPPGYYLYILGGRLVRVLTPLSGQRSLQVISALAAAATVATIYVIGLEARNRWLGVAAAAFMATSPYLVFYGGTVASYCFDALLLVALLWVALRAFPHSRHGLYASVILGLGSGLRPSSVMVVFPMVLWALFKSIRTVRQFLVAGIAGAVSLAVWIVPMILEQPGGYSAYSHFSKIYIKPAFSSTSVFYGATLAQARHNMAHGTSYTLAAVSVLVPLFLAGLVVAVAQRGDGAEHKPGRNAEAVLLFMAAAAVAYAFVLLVHFGKAGYVLSYLPAVALLGMWQLAGARRRLLRLGAGALVGLMILVNLQRFLFAPGVLPMRFINNPHFFFTQTQYGAPFPLTKKYQRQIDRETDEFAAIKDDFDPAKDVVVYDYANGGVRFRHGCYTLPGFRVHLEINGIDHFLYRNRRLATEQDHDIELPVGGRAVFAVDHPDAEINALVAQGRLTAHKLRTGRTVWVAGPGVTIYSLTTTTTPDHPIKEHQP
jgi:hypothetical protein